MDQRLAFVMAHMHARMTMDELCREFQISRKTVNKWTGDACDPELIRNRARDAMAPAPRLSMPEAVASVVPGSNSQSTKGYGHDDLVERKSRCCSQKSRLPLA
jgi:hypothetical protein